MASLVLNAVSLPRTSSIPFFHSTPSPGPFPSVSHTLHSSGLKVIRKLPAIIVGTTIYCFTRYFTTSLQRFSSYQSHNSVPNCPVELSGYPNIISRLSNQNGGLFSCLSTGTTKKLGRSFFLFLFDKEFLGLISTEKRGSAESSEDQVWSPLVKMWTELQGGC